MSESEVSTDRPQFIASRLHLAIFLWIQMAVVFRGGSTLRRFMQVTDVEALHSRVTNYLLLTIVFQWGLVLFVWWGIRKTGTSLRSLVGGRWSSLGSIAKDVGIGLIVWFLWCLGFAAFAWMSGMQHETRNEVQALMPTNALTLGLWILMSLTAGFCEELLYRGYLQRQFLAMSGSVRVAVVAQGLLFGAVHSYQGLTAVVIIAGVGIMFGTLAAWLRSLRPGMIAHAWYDGIIGVLMYLMSILRR
jgi:uncharacterized protein